MDDNQTINCGCGCGGERLLFDKRGRERHFLPGHHAPESDVWSQERKQNLSQVKRKNWEQKFPEGRSCKECERVFPIEHFLRYSRYRTLCHECSVEDTRIRQGMRDYRLSKEEVIALRQKVVCEICGNDNATHIDHDHQTGEVRGKLCNNCNSGIGMLNDDPDRLMAAAAYLLKSKDVLGELQRSF